MKKYHHTADYTFWLNSVLLSKINLFTKKNTSKSFKFRLLNDIWKKKFFIHLRSIQVIILSKVLVSFWFLAILLVYDKVHMGHLHTTFYVSRILLSFYQASKIVLHYKRHAVAIFSYAVQIFSTNVYVVQLLYESILPWYFYKLINLIEKNKKLKGYSMNNLPM